MRPLHRIVLITTAIASRIPKVLVFLFINKTAIIASQMNPTFPNEVIKIMIESNIGLCNF